MEWNIKENKDKEKLAYEGEFKNGEINGKGKEYERGNHRLIFEGEFLNGKRSGKGKEYFDSIEIFKEFEEYLKNRNIYF